MERKDGYFGIHFDLHPSKSDTVLGRDVTEDNIRAFLHRVRPDYVQYDCVGVPGYSGYPTKVGWPAPGIVKDSLAIWRKVTREEQVALLIHYCVLWNQTAVEHHPDWAAVNAHGVRDKAVLSIFSPFAERLLIPQLKEAATLYDLDGAWMDADAWVARLDYSPAALAEWKRQRRSCKAAAGASTTCPRVRDRFRTPSSRPRAKWLTSAAPARPSASTAPACPRWRCFSRRKLTGIRLMVPLSAVPPAGTIPRARSSRCWSCITRWIFSRNTNCCRGSASFPSWSSPTPPSWPPISAWHCWTTWTPAAAWCCWANSVPGCSSPRSA
jgi:hypothetical protein